MRLRARGRTGHTPGHMNKAEQRYAQHLELRRHTESEVFRIDAYWFEPVGLRLAKKTFYHPDFMVVLASGLVEFHEVKGHWEDDARVKIKVAANTYPHFRFLAVTARSKKDGGGWVVEEIVPA